EVARDPVLVVRGERLLVHDRLDGGYGVGQRSLSDLRCDLDGTHAVDPGDGRRRQPLLDGPERGERLGSVRRAHLQVRQLRGPGARILDQTYADVPLLAD